MMMKFLPSLVSTKQVTYQIELIMVLLNLDLSKNPKVHGQSLLLLVISINLVSVKLVSTGFSFNLICLKDGKKLINLFILFTILLMYEQELILQFSTLNHGEEAICLSGKTIVFLLIQMIINLVKTFCTQIKQ